MSRAQGARRAGGGANPFGADPFGPGGPFAAYGAGGAGGGNVRYEFHGAGGEDFSDFFRTFFGGAAAADPAATTARRGGSAGAGGAGTATGSRRSSRPFDDLFRGFAPTERPARQLGRPAPAQGPTGPTPRGRGTRHGDDVEVEVDLSLEEAFNGSARLVQVGERRLEVKLPAGVETGSKIRLSGKAGSGSDAGDCI